MAEQFWIQIFLSNDWLETLNPFPFKRSTSDDNSVPFSRKVANWIHSFAMRNEKFCLENEISSFSEDLPFRSQSKMRIIPFKVARTLFRYECEQQFPQLWTSSLCFRSEKLKILEIIISFLMLAPFLQAF